MEQSESASKLITNIVKIVAENYHRIRLENYEEAEKYLQEQAELVGKSVKGLIENSEYPKEELWPHELPKNSKLCM